MWRTVGCITLVLLFFGGVITMLVVITKQENAEKNAVTESTWTVTDHYNDFKLYPWEKRVTIINLHSSNPKLDDIQVIAAPGGKYFQIWHDLQKGQRIHVSHGRAFVDQGGQAPYAPGLIPKPDINPR